LPWKKPHPKEGSLKQETGLKFKEVSSEVLHLAHSFCVVLKCGHFAK
jgi:hypothetical protein